MIKLAALLYSVDQLHQGVTPW